MPSVNYHAAASKLVENPRQMKKLWDGGDDHDQSLVQ
jgi:hypothetical protein